MKIFCLIPAYNEKGNLIRLVEGIVRIIPKFSREYKIFFVIQGKDGSINLLKKLKLENKNIDWAYFEKALGIGKAYKIGFDNIDRKFTHILTMDADLNHDPSVLGEFIKTMKINNADLVVGSRFIDGGAFNDKRQWKRFISFILNKIIIIAAKIRINDISSGYRLIKRGVVEKIKNELRELGYPSYMEFAVLAYRHGYKLFEVPIVYKSRVWGKSKMGKLRTLYDYIGFLIHFLFI